MNVLRNGRNGRQGRASVAVVDAPVPTRCHPAAVARLAAVGEPAPTEQALLLALTRGLKHLETEGGRHVHDL